MYGLTADPYRREVVEVTCYDAFDAAQSGDEGAIRVHDEMRVRNRGSVVVLVRPGDDLWGFAYEALQISSDQSVVTGTASPYGCGHA